MEYGYIETMISTENERSTEMKVSVKCPNCGSGNNWIVLRKDVSLFNDEIYETIRNQIINDWGADAHISKVRNGDSVIFEHKCGDCEEHFYSRHMLKVEVSETATNMDFDELYNEKL